MLENVRDHYEPTHEEMLNRLDELRHLCLAGRCERATCPFCPEPQYVDTPMDTTDDGTEPPF